MKKPGKTKKPMMAEAITSTAHQVNFTKGGKPRMAAATSDKMIGVRKGHKP